MKKFIFLLLLFLAGYGHTGAQSSPQDTLRIKVKVKDKENPHIWMYFFAVNKRTSTGTFGDRWSEFDLTILRTDTIIVKANGYIPMQFCMKDSVYTPFKMFTIELFKEAILLPEATVVTIREFKEIEADIKRLEKKKTSSYAEGYTKIQSPITALYEAFSKLEREKSKVADLEFEDRKRELLKELLAKYVKGDIMVLAEEEFDDFITFADPDMAFIQYSSQYELIMYFKARYKEYDLYVRRK